MEGSIDVRAAYQSIALLRCRSCQQNGRPSGNGDIGTPFPSAKGDALPDRAEVQAAVYNRSRLVWTCRSGDVNRKTIGIHLFFDALGAAPSTGFEHEEYRRLAPARRIP
jgi:hypothetical protein